MLAKGNTAEVFEYEGGKVCKLFHTGFPQKYAELEYKNAVELFDMKMPVAEPFGMVTVDGRSGILYEKICGEPLSGLISKGGDRMPDMFTELHLKWLGNHSKKLMSYKTYLSVMVRRKGVSGRKLLEEILELPDDDCILHGDFHPDNILIRENDGVPVVIDFMNVCRGPALYDIARTFFLLKLRDGRMADRYLNKMTVSEKDILLFLNVIEQCRMYEG